MTNEIQSYYKHDPVVECITSIFEIHPNMKTDEVLVIDSTALFGLLYRNNDMYNRRTIAAALKRLGYSVSVLVKNPKTRINHTIRFNPEKINMSDAVELAKFHF